jgi:hypothetical protein
MTKVFFFISTGLGDQALGRKSFEGRRQKHQSNQN